MTHPHSGSSDQHPGHGRYTDGLPDDSTQVFPPIRTRRDGSYDTYGSGAGDYDELPAAPSRDDFPDEARGLARWFNVKTLTTEILLTAVISGVVSLFAVAVADTALARLSSAYSPLGWGFAGVSAIIVFLGTLLAAGVFLLLLAGSRSPYTLYKLLFWVTIPSLVLLTLLTTFSLTATPYVLVILIWTIPVVLIPTRADTHRID